MALQKLVVGEETVVGGSWNVYGVGSAGVINELDLGGEGKRFFMHENDLDFEFVPGDSEIPSFGELQIQLEIGNILDDFVFKVEIFVAVVDDPKGWRTLESQRYYGQNHLLPVKQKPWIRSFSFQCHV